MTQTLGGGLGTISMARETGGGGGMAPVDEVNQPEHHEIFHPEQTYPLSILDNHLPVQMQPENTSMYLRMDDCACAKIPPMAKKVQVVP